MTDALRPDVIGAGAPEVEIEITPAMLEAGVLAWSQGDEEFYSPDEIVSRIFREMIEAKRLACRDLDSR
jgi:hypothetical protein